MSATAELAERLVAALRRSNATLALAESCTGGAVAAAITEVAGASTVLWGGAVVYSPEAKVVLGGVTARSIELHGTVSEAMTRELAEGARNSSGATFGAAVTGWAGPAHGDEPVGTVYVAIAAAHGSSVGRQVYDGDRSEVRQQAVDAVLAATLLAVED